MFRIAIALLVVAVLAAIFGFGGIAATATDFAKIVFVVALVLAVVSFIAGGRGSSTLVALLAAGGLLTGGASLASAQAGATDDQVGHIACEAEATNEAGGFC